MANVKKIKGTIAILTGGGDVPGLNPAIRAVTIRARREGYRVLGLRRGWAGLVEIIRDKKVDNSEHFQELDEEIVNKAGRTGGTFLHSSRTKPSKVKKGDVPPHLAEKYNAEINDLTPEVLANLDFLGIDYLIPIGGDDTLSYGVRLYQEGVKVVAIPKTMDNDVPGTDYCIGFSTCVTRTIEMTNRLRTSAGSHERFLVLEVFGRYAGFTAMLPTMAGAANRCVIPEHEFDIERSGRAPLPRPAAEPESLRDRSGFRGRHLQGRRDGLFEMQETDAYGHAQAGWHRRSRFGGTEGSFTEVQRRSHGQRHQPEAGLPGALRRSRCHRLDRANGIRQSGTRSHPDWHPRSPGGAQERSLRQRAG